MKPRQIAVSEQALAELPGWFPVVELVGYTEKQLADGVFQQALDENPHDFYLVASDDLIVRWPALCAVYKELAAAPDRVSTGYCQFTHTDWRVNATRKPIGEQPTVSAYSFLSFHEVVSGAPLQRTWFTGMSLTGMSAEMWQRFPFGCYADKPDDKGYASDFHLSKRLQDADVPIQLVRDGFAYHWRHEQQHTNDPRDNRVLVGEVRPEIRVR